MMFSSSGGSKPHAHLTQMSPAAGDARLASGSKIPVDTMVAIVYAQEGTKTSNLPILFLLHSQTRVATILIY